MRLRHRAYTLVELITVIAISAVILSIILVPMVQSFNVTRAAQSYSDAQAKAREIAERISKEIAEAGAIRPNDGLAGAIRINLPVPNDGVDDNGAPVVIGGGYRGYDFLNTKLDIILPAQVGSKGPGGAYIDPNTGKEDPTLGAAKGQIRLPLAPGTTVRRYWIGLKDPFRNYNNNYDGLLMARQGGVDNLVVLYVAEVEPMVRSGASYVVDNRYFDSLDVANTKPNYDDPSFFIATNANIGAPVNNDAKATRIRNWLSKAKIVTELSRYDMILPQFDKNSRKVKVDTVGGVPIPRVRPLISFKPTKVDANTPSASVAAPLGQENEGIGNAGSDIYTTEFGAWSNPIIRVKPANWNPTQAYLITKPTGSSNILHFIDPALGGTDTASGVGVPMFNMSDYETFAKDNSRRYWFTSAMAATSGWMASADVRLGQLFTPHHTDANRGRVITSFGIREVGDEALTPNLFDPADTNPDNLPQNLAGNAFTPANDPNVAVGTFDQAPFWNATYNNWNINRVFNKVWADAQANRNGIPTQFGEVGNAHRFIDLRNLSQSDGTASPLRLFPRAQIVPGSEEVFGPDQNPGANAGYEIRYRRVTGEPGPNEYRINYTNVAEPTAAGYIAMGFAGPPPGVYDRTNFLSAIVQPRYKVGYLQLCSQPEVSVPDSMMVTPSGGAPTAVPGRIRVNYRFQFSQPGDIVQVDADTRELMSVNIVVRNYAQSNLPNPQTVMVQATANVKNFLR